MAIKSRSKATQSARQRPHIEPIMRLQALAADTCELLIYGDIGDSWWGESVTAQSVAQQLNELDDTVATINVRINSYGGSVSDGLAIYNSLRRHKARKSVTVDGVAMSSASLIAMAGDTVSMPPASILMIHAPWGMVVGNSRDAREYADTLDTFAEAMADAYVRKSGKSRDEVLALLQDGEDHYFTGEEAVAEGFADDIAEDGDGNDSPDESARAYAAELLSRISARGAPAHYAGLVVTAALRGAPRVNHAPPAGAVPSPVEAGHASREATMPASSTATSALAADQSRRETIRNHFAPFRLRADLDQVALASLQQECEDNHGMTPEAASQKLLGMLGRDTTPSGAGNRDEIEARGGEPAGRDFVQAASDALVMQAGIRIEKPHAGARDVAGMGLHGIIRACAQRSGRFHGNNLGDAIRAALSTSDFPAILENALNKTLRSGYESEQQTFTAWTRLVEVPDFKLQSRVILGSAPDLKPVLEGAEYEFGSMDEDKATYSVNKWGRLVQFTWEAMINDDLGAFLRMTQAMGLAAARAEADNIYNTFGLNAGAGPTMQDGVTLFHDDHHNLATSSTALDADALAKARVLLRRQTALGGGALNLPPRFLLVAPEHEQAAEILLAAAARSLSQGNDQTLVPAWLAKLELVVEARLSDDAVYLLTSPSSIDTLERAWLESDGGPVIKEEDGFYVDARTYKVRHVFGCRWLDFRGAVKLPIASGG